MTMTFITLFSTHFAWTLGARGIDMLLLSMLGVAVAFSAYVVIAPKDTMHSDTIPFDTEEVTCPEPESGLQEVLSLRTEELSEALTRIRQLERQIKEQRNEDTL